MCMSDDSDVVVPKGKGIKRKAKKSKKPAPTLISCGFWMDYGSLSNCLDFQFENSNSSSLNLIGKYKNKILFVESPWWFSADCRACRRRGKRDWDDWQTCGNGWLRVTTTNWRTVNTSNNFQIWELNFDEITIPVKLCWSTIMWFGSMWISLGA